MGLLDMAKLAGVSLGMAPVVFGYIEAMRLPGFQPYGLALPFVLLAVARSM